VENHPIPKLNKIWPIFENLEKKFVHLYTPERDVTLYESLLLYKRRLGWAQHPTEESHIWHKDVHAERV
jgi:hypothetical protein